MFVQVTLVNHGQPTSGLQTSSCSVPRTRKQRPHSTDTVTWPESPPTLWWCGLTPTSTLSMDSSAVHRWDGHAIRSYYSRTETVIGYMQNLFSLLIKLNLVHLFLWSRLSVCFFVGILRQWHGSWFPDVWLTGLQGHGSHFQRLHCAPRGRCWQKDLPGVAGPGIHWFTDRDGV